jgi:MraZ protein
MFYRGTFNLAADTKGRIAIPKAFRDDIAENSANKVVVTMDIESDCLLFYKFSDWEPLEEKVMALPNTTNPQIRMLQRRLIGSARAMELDGQGRILLPERLKSFAQIERSVVMIGQGNKFEIWSEQKWDELFNSFTDASGLDEAKELLQDLVL